MRKATSWITSRSFRSFGAISIGTKCITLILGIAALELHADQVQMQNGDRYFGRVQSLTTNTLILKSDVLGTLRLPREKVALITFDGGPATNRLGAAPAPNGKPTPPLAAPTNAFPDLSESLRDLGTNTNLIEQVRAQFLGAAGPEANNK